MNANNDVILIAEDDDDYVFFISELLKDNHIGCLLQHAHNGQEAIDYLNNKNGFKNRIPVTLFIDLTMPKVSGYELLDWVRSQRELAHLPIIVISGSDKWEDQRHSYHLGADAFFRKDELLRDPKEFIAEIHKHIPGDK